MREGGQRAGNIAWEATVVRGDIDAAFARDDVTIVESSSPSAGRTMCRSNRAPSSRSCEDGRYHIETSTQVPWTVRNVTARLLGIRGRAGAGHRAALSAAGSA